MPIRNAVALFAMRGKSVYAQRRMECLYRLWLFVGHDFARETLIEFRSRSHAATPIFRASASITARSAGRAFA